MSLPVNRPHRMQLEDHPPSVAKRILVVEDNDLNRKLFSDLLKAKGFDVEPLADGFAVIERARAFAKRLKCTLAVIDKRRTGPNVAEVMHLFGDVRDKVSIILDDMIDTAGTLTQAAKALKENGARAIYACATHGVLSGPAIERINNSDIEEVVLTDTIPLGDKGQDTSKIRVLSVAELLAEAIRRIHGDESVSSLFV